MAIGGKSCAINVCLPLVVRIAFLRGVYVGEATNSETGKPGNNFWNVVDAELQTIREKKGNDPVRISRFFARILKNDCDLYDPDSVESLKELIETSSVSLNDE
ncbi:hypothetical protein EV359DRAFT_86774 [Lentinula novae-zelandiae]|nr:hypothetical protein EV359DRAFT_86774 [Lentinula novae-zelandiae]